MGHHIVLSHNNKHLGVLARSLMDSIYPTARHQGSIVTNHEGSYYVSGSINFGND